MTKEKIQKLRALAQAMHDRMTPTVWNQLLADSGMFQDDYMIQCCAPRTILDLFDRIEKLEADRAVLLDCVKFYAPANSYDYEKTQAVNYIWNDQGKRAREALKEVGE